MMEIVINVPLLWDPFPMRNINLFCLSLLYIYPHAKWKKKKTVWVRIESQYTDGQLVLLNLLSREFYFLLEKFINITAQYQPHCFPSRTRVENLHPESDVGGKTPFLTFFSHFLWSSLQLSSSAAAFLSKKLGKCLEVVHLCVFQGWPVAPLSINAYRWTGRLKLRTALCQLMLKYFIYIYI